MVFLIISIFLILFMYRTKEVLLTSKVVSKGKIDFSTNNSSFKNKYLSYIQTIIKSPPKCFPALTIKLEDNRIFVYPDPVIPNEILLGHSVLIDETEYYFIFFTKKLLISKQYTLTINRKKYNFKLVNQKRAVS